MRSSGHRRRRPAERSLTGGHLVEHRAEREQVGARVEVFAPRQFRRHVRHRAHGDARTRKMLRVGDGRCGRCVGSHGLAPSDCELREAKVEQLGPARLGDEDVGGFQVAMDDPFLVRRVERIDDLDGDLDKVGR